ncbi:MAG: MFS transporter [Anaerolineales bacterium]|nr:MFS transporter [Anaerolineales bacterium]MCS7247602.1 MFS transporter [Anaerolineales bacterium]MDW8161413.1 MFS transporter [Anaerolineales bacterium]MDW8446660.1 MFS transporter [Anaerolineales bacterium]
MTRLRIPPALRYPRFRYLWMALILSTAGANMQLWAIFWHVRSLTPHPIALGMIGLVRVLPVTFFSLLGGVAADRYNRRLIFFLTQCVLTFVAGALACLTFRRAITIWHIYALTALQATAVAFDLPARQALVPNLVSSKDLPNAFSLGSIAFQIGAIVGPALGGWTIATWGQAYPYLINALSYVAVLFAIWRIGPVAQQRIRTRHVLLDWQAIREGWLFILGQPLIFSSMVLDFFATFFSSANTLMPIVARDILGVGEVEYGWLSSAQAIGAVLAGLVLSQMGEVRRQGPLFLFSVVCFGLATILFGLARVFWLAMLALILIGAADAVSTILRNTIRQLLTPDYLRGRMVSVNQIFFLGGPQLGEVEAGVVAQLFGVPFAIVSGGIGCLLAVVWVARRWPQLWTVDRVEPLAAD